MNKIHIKKSHTADTRTCDVTKVSKETLLKSSEQHIGDVKNAIYFICSRMTLKAMCHDSDKLSNIDQFYADFKTKFVQHEWWDNHKKIQKHHLNEVCDGYNEINLLDIIEHIVDCCMAGLGRSGIVYPLNISNELLQMAVKNTVKLLVENTVVED